MQAHKGDHPERQLEERPVLHGFFLEGVWQGDITPVLYSSNDLLGALWRSSGGGYGLEVVPGRERQRAQALRLAINVVLFALTGNYKRDAVHVRTLLKRMRRQGGYAR